MKTRITLVFIFTGIVWIPGARAGHAAPGNLPGLHVEHGRLFLNGKPFRGIGANYFRLFYQTLQAASDTSYENKLHRLADLDVPFVRFMACGFWPVDWDLYFEDKEEYFNRLDRIVACAESNHIGLIPSLFWYMPTVPDLVGESMDQLGNPESKTIRFVKKYTREVVSRYKDSPAIWGWEFGNEYSLCVDLPNASEHRPKVVPRLKTALERTAQDELTSSAMLTAFSEFAAVVREEDPYRILITGNSLPRPSAYHNTLEKSWRKDTPDQFREILLRDNPDPFSVLSVHLYPPGKDGYPSRAGSFLEIVEILQSISKETGKPLFIGEFGASREMGKETERSAFTEMVRVIETTGVPLAAFWVFDLPSQESTWNVTFDNERSYMLEIVSAANRRIREVRSQGHPPTNTAKPNGPFDKVFGRGFLPCFTTRRSVPAFRGFLPGSIQDFSRPPCSFPVSLFRSHIRLRCPEKEK